MAEYIKPLPFVNEDNAQYWEYCKKHELRMQKCSQCGHIRFPPSIVCPKCHSMEADWAILSGKGKVYSFVVFDRAFHESYRNDIPYVVALIQLDEGLRIESNITGCGVDDVKIDMPVEVYFDDVTKEFALPKFKPARQEFGP